MVQDLSPRPGGAYWGEVNSNIHRTLGSQGVITNGAVRDTEEVKALDFHFFSRGIEVSRGFAHLEDFNWPVTVLGIAVHPGDLIHADAVIVPLDAIDETLETAHWHPLTQKRLEGILRFPERRAQSWLRVQLHANAPPTAWRFAQLIGPITLMNSETALGV